MVAFYITLLIQIMIYYTVSKVILLKSQSVLVPPLFKTF